MDHDHSTATHTAQCDEPGCTYVAQVHAHDDDMAVDMLAQDLATHNENEHSETTDPGAILSAVREKTKKLG